MAKEIRITVSKKEYEQIKGYAELDDRSMANFVYGAVMSHMRRHPKNLSNISIKPDAGTGNGKSTEKLRILK